MTDNREKDTPSCAVEQSAVPPAQPPGDILASARAMDLEYTAPQAAPAGIETVCGNCGHPVYLDFDVSVQAFEALVLLATAHLGVSRRDLLVGGKRPTSRVHQARILLVKALFKVAGEEAGSRWLSAIGWETRRIRSLAESELLWDRAIALLEELGPTLQLEGEGSENQ